LKEPVDNDSLVFCGIEFQTIGAGNRNTLRLTALVIRGTCRRLNEDEQRMNGNRVRRSIMLAFM